MSIWLTAYGHAVGGEFRAAGILQMLGPTVDIARTWHSGRVPEAFGEDPLLSGEMAATSSGEYRNRALPPL